ncbi:uncharacterized protein N7482_004095 [Penicillium canariense]|uniref:Carboxypeptidase n=1 Tax=Penicillium canariense TaxID=189055 RepID=A0A9W9I5X8_9EURO|nr:uncharacterized protein N7482_004095 [Penicillium canariense]KAJ5168501.1 hypothetical protein N7482_004095 [Penicillium canariense]
MVMGSALEYAGHRPAEPGSLNLLNSQLEIAPAPYNPSRDGNNSIEINLFVESYGGHYGPAFAAYFEEQAWLKPASFRERFLGSI